MPCARSGKIFKNKKLWFTQIWQLPRVCVCYPHLQINFKRGVERNDVFWIGHVAHTSDHGVGFIFTDIHLQVFCVRVMIPYNSEFIVLTPLYAMVKRWIVLYCMYVVLWSTFFGRMFWVSITEPWRSAYWKTHYSIKAEGSFHSCLDRLRSSESLEVKKLFFCWMAIKIGSPFNMFRKEQVSHNGNQKFY